MTSVLYLKSGYDIFPVGDKFIEKRLERLYEKEVKLEERMKLWSPYIPYGSPDLKA